jgi:hypothetical protein
MYKPAKGTRSLGVCPSARLKFFFYRDLESRETWFYNTVMKHLIQFFDLFTFYMCSIEFHLI